MPGCRQTILTALVHVAVRGCVVCYGVFSADGICCGALFHLSSSENLHFRRLKCLRWSLITVFLVELIEESCVGCTPGWDCLNLWSLLWHEGCCEPWLPLCCALWLCPWDPQSSAVVSQPCWSLPGALWVLGTGTSEGDVGDRAASWCFSSRCGQSWGHIAAWGVHPCPCRRSRCCRREWESCSFLPLLGLGSPPSPSNNFSLYKLSLAHLQRQLCTLTCFFLTTVNYAGFLWQTYLTFLILFFLFSTALSKI